MCGVDQPLKHGTDYFPALFLVSPGHRKSAFLAVLASRSLE